jgi:predicted PurR-regulated permease PerM
MKDIPKYLLILAGLALACLIIWYFRNIIAYILIAAVISLIGQPVVDFLCRFHIRKFYLPRSIGALLTLVLFLGLVFIFFRIFVPIVAKQAHTISCINHETVLKSLEKPIHSAETYFGSFGNTDSSGQPFEKIVTGKLMKLISVSDLSNIFSSIAGIFGNIFVALFAISFISFFFLKDNKLFVSWILLLVPVRYERSVKSVMASINRLIRRYFTGICLDMIFIITLVTLGLLLVGQSLQEALIIGLFMGLMNVIPYVGPVIGIIFGLLAATVNHIEADFVSDTLPMLGWMLLVFISINIIDGTLLQPMIFSSSVKAHPLEIFLVIMLAGSLAGIAGMILAIPTYTILRVIAKEFFNEFRVVKKLTENI